MNTSGKFVIQEHTKAGDMHWDLMFESGKVLETYRLNLPPKKLSQQEIASAVRIFDHLLKFLTYEGSVNKGKGIVKIVDSGTYQLLSVDEKQWVLQLDGKVLKGKFTLTCVREKCRVFGLAAE
jgi:hypothetical protein